MKTRLIALSAILVAATAFAAPIELISPRAGETVCLSTPERRAFLEKNREERRAIFLDTAWRRHIYKEVRSEPNPVKLEWKGGAAPYAVKVERCGKTVFATNLTETTVIVWNLEIARDYAWSVQGGGETAKGTFKTMDLAPRDIHLPNVSNIRDLGGRIGLGGKRVKQGMAYRSAGLNSNAHKYCSAKETLKMYKEGTLEEKFGEEGRKVKEQIDKDKGKFKFDPKAPFLRKSLIKEKCKGKPIITPESARYAIDVLGWKSDIDLRRDNETWGMEGSPCGPEVKWWHISHSSYSGMAQPVGKEAFTKVFRVFLDEKNYPLVFHCIGGADRTGAVAFILNALLGVSDDELDKDWEITCFIYEDQSFGHKTRFDKLRAVFDAYPGSCTREKVEAYVKALGFTDADIAKFRSIMLED